MLRSNQTRGFRLMGTYPITQDNQQIPVDLPRGPHLESVRIRIAGTATVGTAFTAVRALAPYALIRRAEVTLNSNVVLDSGSGQQLYSAHYVNRSFPTFSAPPAAGVGAQPFRCGLQLDRVLNDMVRPKDSMLKTDVGVSNLQLRLQMGTLADMFTGAGAATYTNVSASVYVRDYQEARDANGNTPSPAYYIKRTGQRVQLSGAGNGIQFRLNTGNRLRSVVVRMLDSTGEPSDTLLTRVRIQRAGDVRVDMAVADLIDEFGPSFGAGQAARPVGQFVIDFAQPGNLGARYTEFWPIPSSADTFLLVDSSAAGQLDITTIEGVDL